VSASLYEKVWLVAALALIAYPVGDLLDFWQMEPLVVMIGAALILLAGRKVGVAKVRSHG
jgi:hypothetical protein